MVNPISLARNVIKNLNHYRFIKYEEGIIEETNKALGLLTAFINEKEFLELSIKDVDINIQPIKLILQIRLKELTSAIDLLNKNGVKI